MSWQGTRIWHLDEATLLKFNRLAREGRILTRNTVAYSLLEVRDPSTGKIRISIGGPYSYSDRPQYIAQSTGGTISGTVLDESRAALPGVTVTVRQQDRERLHVGVERQRLRPGEELGETDADRTFGVVVSLDLLQPVGDVDDPHPLAAQLADDAEEVVDLALVEHRRGLVEDEEPGVLRERAGHADDLLGCRREPTDLAARRDRV